MVGKALKHYSTYQLGCKAGIKVSLYSKISASDSLQQEGGEGLPVQEHSCMGDGWNVTCRKGP